MALAFKKATKQQAKLRAAFFGPSGAGKTFTALRVASGMGKPIAVIDTERGSASKYADRFEFDVLELPEKTIACYVEAINAAAKAGYPVLIIDSLTHAWQELLTEIDAIAKAKFRGNTWSAWNEGTPKQRRLVDAILNYPGHVIATMRSKTEWSEEKDERTGKVKPVRVGLAPEQGKGIEYEFDLLGEITVDHYMNILKDRTGKYQDATIEKPGEAFGESLIAWLSEGAPMAPQDKPPADPAPIHPPNWRDFTPDGVTQDDTSWTDDQREGFTRALAAAGLKYDEVAEWTAALDKGRPSQWPRALRESLWRDLKNGGRREFEAWLSQRAAS
jgi:hypothetical protein